jgi:predicted CxxxxCH...CXXCH cytochrome family protein
MMKRAILIIIIGLIITIFHNFLAFATIDAPHSDSNNIYCGSCHGQGLLDFNSPFWGGSGTYDQICLSCHVAPSGPYSDINAPLAITHSSATTSTTYGNWSRECVDCHDPHYQKQKNYKSTDSSNLYLASGTITACADNGNGTSTLTYSSITYKTATGWDSTKLTQKTLAYRGTILFPNLGKTGFNYPITAVDSVNKKLTVTGNACTYLSPPTSYAVMYGQYVKDFIDVSGTSIPVKFFDQTGTNSFADGVSTYNGIYNNVCEVCHTQTTHYRNDGSGSDQHHTIIKVGGEDGANCITCHSHTDGFKPSCNICHGYPPPPLASIPLPTGSTTAGEHAFHVTTQGYQCTICHYNSAGSGPTHNDNKITLGFVSLLGSYTGGSYDGQTTANYESSDPGTTVSKTGQKQCSNLYCHGGTMAPDGGTANAIWDNPASGACSTCHGATTGAPPTKGSHSKHAGSAGGGRQLACTVCHSGYTHVNGSVEWAYDTGTYAWLSGALYRGAASGSATPVPSASYGQCSNLYCHSSVQGANGIGPPTFYATPTWGGTVICGDCHANPMTSGNHPAHSLYVCSTCHTSDTAITHSDDYINFNSGITYSLGSAVPPGSGYGTCSNVYCHTNGTNVWTGDIPSNTTPQWDGTLDCNGCHGNTTYSDYRKGTPLYASYPSGTKPNAHVLHTDVRTTPSGEPQCNNCHRSVTNSNTAIDGTTPSDHDNGVYNVVAGNTYKDGDNVGGAAMSVTTTYTYKVTPNTSTCSNVSCHPTGLGGTGHSTSTTWDNAYKCTDCHNINMNNTTGYHHVMDSTAMADRTYPTSAPSGNATDSNRKCTMCHVDHNIFSTMLNNNNTNGRSYNLRTDISTTPTVASGYTNTDYATGGGICISCHTNELTKNTTAQKTETSSTKTMAVTDANFSLSAHKYNVASTMTNGGSTFNSNCSKCHNAKNGETTTFQNSTNKFGTHDDTARRLVAALGGTLADPYEEAFCYRCHSKAADAIGGTKKSADANDWYGAVTNMSSPSTSIYQVFQKTYKHNVAGYSGLHKPSPTDETRTYLSANKHVECDDCHNPHAAKAGLHSNNQVHVAAGTNLISNSGPLTGAQGAGPTSWPGNWGAVSSWPTTTSTATYEYQICFKCHASYNTNYASWGGSGTQSWTDVALEFNPNNASYHPVVQALPATDPGYNGSSQLPPPFTSIVIGDSGLATGISSINSTYLTDSTKNWTTNQWQNWGLRLGWLGTPSKVDGNATYNNVRTITSNNSTTIYFPALSGSFSYSGAYVSYSIEYYAGQGTKSGNTVTDSTKHFTTNNPYLPSPYLVGYVVVITNDIGTNVAKGTVTSCTDTSFTVGSWTNTPDTCNGNGSIPADGTVGYYFSATGHTMMCSDCHSNDTISSTVAQGPHGSAVKWMLKGRNRAWPTTLASDNGTGTIGTGAHLFGAYTYSPVVQRSTNDGTVNGLFCLNCHSTVSFTKEGSGRHNIGNGVSCSLYSHTENPHELHNIACINCHIMVPHGGKMSRLIGDGDSSGHMPVRYAFNNTLSNMYVWYFQKESDPGIYSGDDCYVDSAHCGNYHTGGSEAW